MNTVDKSTSKPNKITITNDQGKPSKDKIEPIENKAKKYQHEDELAKKKEETLNIFVDL